jgi:diguanylate cyclase (GGDEF)-like protein
MRRFAAMSRLKGAVSRSYRLSLRARGFFGTIRGRILIAFLIMSVITGALGGYAASRISRAGVLVARTFDESLMSINYARAAATDFAAMRAAFAQRLIASDPHKRGQLDHDVAGLEQSLTDDLAIAAERSQSVRAAQAAARVKEAAVAWTGLRRGMLEGAAPDAAWDELDRYAVTVDQEIDLLVNYTAGDAFTYRQGARAAVAADIQINLFGTALALILSGLVAWLLARRIIGPVAAASAVAGRIAAGELDGEMPRAGADELGSLLAAMAVMRENIRAMMQRERQHAEARIGFMARHDVLTSLPNRVLFAERLELALAQMGRGAGFAVHCLDLDHFKEVNDTLGHPFGDKLLCAVAERLKACVREVDTVARLGADEFAIVQRDVKQAADAELLARRIVEVVGKPYELEGQGATVGVSIGISLAPADGALGERLLKNADLALGRAKAEARGVWRFFEAGMDARVQARRKLELDLREALARDELALHYQPIYDLERERVSGFEALLRWRHPVRGMVSPAEFIPIAEDTGLIVSIGEWVLHQACAEATRWPEHVMLAVNVSPAQFVHGALLRAVGDALAASGLKAGRLELEITESVLLADSGTTFSTLNALRALGVGISMDDFGTGYSSLSYLRSFPVDKIKIDQSFIRNLSATDGSDMIVRAIIGLGRSLDLTITAEGVETEDQLARLRAEGCNEVQGYFFSPAVPSDQVLQLIERWSGIVVLGTQRVRERARKAVQRQRVRETN